MKRLILLVVIALFVVCSVRTASAQMSPRDLNRDYVVELFMKDSSQIFGIVLVRPVPDRIIFQTRYGRLEIPLQDISYAVDYRFNFVLKDDIMQSSSKNAIMVEREGLTQFSNAKQSMLTSVVSTNTHDIFYGNRYLYDDTEHIALATTWGDLYFDYRDLSEIDNYDSVGDRRTDFHTPSYLSVKDLRASQAFITPTAFAYGSGNSFLADYLFGGLQANFGPTDWLSLNLGGAFLPLKNTITIATGGFKVTPLSTDLWHLAFGAQGLYSDVINITKFGFGFGALTYGTWDGNLTMLAGVSIKNALDSNGIRYTSNESVVSFAGSERVGENLKISLELLFISNFDIVPAIASIRFFDNNLTIDVGVVLSLYKSGAARTDKTLGEYVFNAVDFPIIPVVSGSYHF